MKILPISFGGGNCRSSQFSFGLITALALALALACLSRADEAEQILLHQQLPTNPSIILIDANIGKRGLLMVLDTGADHSVLSSNLESLVIPLPQRKGLYETDSLRVQSLAIAHPRFALLDLHGQSQIVGKQLDGILGASELHFLKFHLNAEAHTVAIHTGPWVLEGAEINELSLDKTDIRPRFFADVHGRLCDLLIDTGYDGNISLDPFDFDYFVKRGVIEIANDQLESQAIEGRKRGRHGWFIKGDLLGKSLKGISVESGGATGHGNIGMGFLHGFNSEIDFASHTLRYKVLLNQKPPLAILLMLGAAITYDRNGAHIEWTIPGGCAERAGLLEGDTITNFGGLSGAGLNSISVSELVTAKAAGALQIQYFRHSESSKVNAELNLPAPISDWDFAGRESRVDRAK